MDIVEGDVIDVRITTDYGYRSGSYPIVGVLRVQTGTKVVDVRFRGYTGYITIMKGHRIRAYGQYVNPNVFLANRIENLTTGEFWEIIPPRESIKMFTIIALVFVVISIVIFVMMHMLMVSVSPYAPDSAFTAMWNFIIITFVLVAIMIVITLLVVLGYVQRIGKRTKVYI